ncbi:MAG: hypothetical protein ACLRMX_05275 [Lachnospira eligens]
MDIIKNNIIEETGYNLNVMEGAEVINAEGLIVALRTYGYTHVHFRIQGLLIKRILLLEQQQQQRWFYSVV